MSEDYSLLLLNHFCHISSLSHLSPYWLSSEAAAWLMYLWMCCIVTVVSFYSWCISSYWLNNNFTLVPYVTTMIHNLVSLITKGLFSVLLPATKAQRWGSLVKTLKGSSQTLRDQSFSNGYLAAFFVLCSLWCTNGVCVWLIEPQDLLTFKKLWSVLST